MPTRRTLFERHEGAAYPSAPPIVREPMALGGLPIPSRFFLAPLAGYTSLAFRLAVRQCGGLGLVTTDLVNARSIVEKRGRAFELAETCPEDRPMSIQLYGHVASEMRQAARWAVVHGASAVDINMGCPVNKVVKSGGGSALMCQTDAAVELVAAVVDAVEVPVTVKMRLGWDDETLIAPALARALEGAGVAAVIVHGRTRAQGFRGTSTARASARSWRPSSGSRSSATATSGRSPTPPRPSARPAARPSRSVAGRSRTRSSSASSRTGPSTAPPAPRRPSRNAST
ncbi:MAG: tRNA-dihydrouridine synthase family protein [Planctomycetaceae bacterium]|nr:tRNA-dihydrouridine synthase family protein [Planctomycetaceae bacterium]